MYEVELMSISKRTTVNTFNYLDLNGDKRISAEEAESLVRMFMKALSTDLGIDVQVSGRNKSAPVIHLTFPADSGFLLYHASR